MAPVNNNIKQLNVIVREESKKLGKAFLLYFYFIYLLFSEITFPSILKILINYMLGLTPKVLFPVHRRVNLFSKSAGRYSNNYFFLTGAVITYGFKITCFCFILFYFCLNQAICISLLLFK